MSNEAAVTNTARECACKIFDCRLMGSGAADPINRQLAKLSMLIDHNPAMTKIIMDTFTEQYANLAAI